MLNAIKSSEGQGVSRVVKGRLLSYFRNYTCGCGKTYLSYPALYLHLKNKHNGVSPKGTQLPNTSGKRRNKVKISFI